MQNGPKQSFTPLGDLGVDVVEEVGRSGVLVFVKGAGELLLVLPLLLSLLLMLMLLLLLLILMLLLL